MYLSDWFIWPRGKETYVCHFKKCMSWSGLSETSFCENLSAGHLACEICSPRWMTSSIQCKVLIVCSDASARIYDRDGVWAQFWRIFEENCWQPIPMHQLGCLGSSVPLYSTRMMFSYLFMISFWVGSTVWSTQCGYVRMWCAVVFGIFGLRIIHTHPADRLRHAVSNHLKISDWICTTQKCQRKLLEGDMYVRQMEHTKGHTQTLTAGMWHPFRWGWCWLVVACYWLSCPAKK